MIRRKTEASSVEKKLVTSVKTRKPNPKEKIENMPDAIQDGVWAAPIGSELIVVKNVGGKTQRSFCKVKSVSADLVSTWDITFERWFSFKIEEIASNGVILKISSISSESH